MAGMSLPGYKPPIAPVPVKPPYPLPQPGSYQDTVGGSTYYPSPEEQAEAERLADLQRQAEEDSWLATSRIDASRQADQAYADQNQRYADQRSDRREGIAAMQGLLSGMGGFGGSGGGGGAGGSGGSGGYSPSADAATYGRAKDNTGLALTAAQKGLDEAMNRRGIFGSGIHAANLEDLYAAGLGDLAETDRQLAEGTADRGFRSSEAALGRSWESGERAADRAAGLATSKLQAILNLYGMVY